MFAMQHKTPIKNKSRKAADISKKTRETAGNPVWTKKYYDMDRETGQKPETAGLSSAPVIQGIFAVNRDDLTEAGLRTEEFTQHHNERLAEKQTVTKYLNALGIKLMELYPVSDPKSPLSTEEIGAAAGAVCRDGHFGDNRILVQNEYFIPLLARIPRYLFFEKDAAHDGRSEGSILNLTELFAMDAYVQSYGDAERETLGLGARPANLSGYHRSDRGEVDFFREEVNLQGEKKKREYDPLQTPEDAGQQGRYNKWLNEYAAHAGGKGAGAVCILDVSFASLPQINLWIKIFGEKLKKIKSAYLANDVMKKLSQDENFTQEDTHTPELDEKYSELIQICNTYVVSYAARENTEKIEELKQIFDDAREYLKKWFEESEQLENWRAEQCQEVGLGGFFDDFS